MTDAHHFASATPHGLAGTRLSRTETESLCLKASRGAGHSWGIAEEAAAAAVWLCARGIDGTSALLAAIAVPCFTPPTMSARRWTDPGGRNLCPLLTGAALPDFAFVNAGLLGGATRLGPVRQPVLLLPFLSRCAEMSNTVIRLDWAHRSFHIGHNIQASGVDVAALVNASSAVVTASMSDQLIEASHSSFTPGQFALALPDTLDALDALARRTTVPASEASRNSGAGAGTSDND